MQYVLLCIWTCQEIVAKQQQIKISFGSSASKKDVGNKSLISECAEQSLGMLTSNEKMLTSND